MDGRVQAERLFDDLGMEREALQGVVRQGREIGTELRDLLLVQLVHDLGTRGEPEDNPGNGRGGRVLPGHEERDHHMSDFQVGDRGPLLVGTGHEVPDHIIRVFRRAFLAARADDFEVRLGHLLLCVISLAVVRERSPRQHEIDRRKAHVEIVIEISKGRVKLAADFLPLQRPRGRVNGDFGHRARYIESPPVGVLESGGALEKRVHFLDNERNVGAERFTRQAEFHHLGDMA